ncbi:MAG: FAD-binding protein [Alphaproteobacteria bacterium]|nr:FAD-binding protein [Alphaproteobacteria bacterium]
MIVTRRNLLLAGGGIAALGAAGVTTLALNAGDPPERELPPVPPGKVRWSNWSGLQTCIPKAIAVPADINELQHLLRTSSDVVRPVGAGHSFGALVPTEGTIVSLDRLSALAAHDAQAMTATVGAGVRLFNLGEMLDGIGQAMNALPDINKQSLAGAIATATHGAGANLGSLSSAIAGLQLMTADGALIDCDASKNAELFDAARVSVGALGIVTQVKLQNRGPLTLRRKTWFEPIGDAIAAAPERARTLRHYEFYYITFTDMAYCISHEETDEPVTPRKPNSENEGAEELMTLRDWFSWAPWLRRMIGKGLIANQETESVVGPAWRLLSTDRPMRFNEMEYHLPREALTSVLPQVIAAIERHSEAYFPIEVRFVAEDDAWLSPFYKRPTLSIAVHMGHTQNHDFYFSEIEPIYRRVEGRPHWGKLHSLKAADLAALYPHFRDFQAMRAEKDPGGRFMNPYLRALFVG